LERWKEDLASVRPWTELALKRLEEQPTTERMSTWQNAVRANIEASHELDLELASVGVPFSVGELANVRAPYPEAIPVLLRHLDGREYPNDIIGSIIGALAVKYAGEDVLNHLIAYLSANSGKLSKHVLYTLGNAIAEIAPKDRADELLAIANTADYSHARLGPLLKLARLRVPGSADVAVKMLQQGDSTWFALKALALSKAFAHRDLVEPYVSSENIEVRRVAKQFIAAATKADPKRSLLRPR